MMQKDVALLILRLSGLGLAFAHGWAKVRFLSAGEGEQFISAVESFGFPAPVVFAWAAALAEFAGGLLIGLGLFTRVSAAFAAITMFVASFFRHHFHHQLLAWLGVMHLPRETLEGWGNPERALTYLLIFLGLVLLGGGRFSLDRVLRKKRGA